LRWQTATRARRPHGPVGGARAGQGEHRHASDCSWARRSADGGLDRLGRIGRAWERRCPAASITTPRGPAPRRRQCGRSLRSTVPSATHLARAPPAGLQIARGSPSAALSRGTPGAVSLTPPSKRQGSAAAVRRRRHSPCWTARGSTQSTITGVILRCAAGRRPACAARPRAAAVSGRRDPSTTAPDRLPMRGPARRAGRDGSEPSALA